MGTALNTNQVLNKYMKMAATDGLRPCPILMKRLIGTHGKGPEILTFAQYDYYGKR